MSWLQPTQSDYEFVTKLQADKHCYHLLQVSALLPRIEPDFLRNARLQFAPGSDVELEADIWFHSVMHSRNARAVVMRGGVARVLAQQLGNNKKAFTEAQKFVAEHTRHWLAKDRLEQQLRLHALTQDHGALQQGLRSILKTLVQTQDIEQRRELARWIKGALPSLIANADEETAQWLTAYLAAVLGSTGWRVSGEAHQVVDLPPWLSNTLTESRAQKIDLLLRPGVLQCLPAGQGKHSIELNLPLPTLVKIDTKPGTYSRWHSLWPGRDIFFDHHFSSLTLQTLNGHRYRLTIAETDDDIIRQVKLIYMPEDITQANSIKTLLAHNNINVELIEDSKQQQSLIAEQTFPVLRLWTQHAAEYWRDTSLELDASAEAKALLLTTERNLLLPQGVNETQVINYGQAITDSKSPQTEKLLTAIQAWLAGELTAEDIAEQETEESAAQAEQQYTLEVKQLLAELNKPETTPPRRLQIGDRLAEIGDPRPGVGVREIEIIEYATEVQQLFDELQDIKTEPPRRLQIGDELAKMVDPRPGVGLDESGLPDIDWLEIPAGEFIYGEGKEQQTLELETFYLSRYPVTNLQFQSFFNDGGYEDERWWQGLKKPEPEPSTWPQSNRPKTNVDWYETIAFCRWLSNRLGYQVTLPTERQWEKAARGNDGREYPWGNGYQSGYANVNEKENNVGRWYLEQTNAVGMYPHGNSPYGPADMSGNVWEWCLNKYTEEKNTTIDDSNDERVLRGGSWLHGPEFARLAGRHWDYPDLRHYHGGFRVCCLLPFTEH